MRPLLWHLLRHLLLHRLLIHLRICLRHITLGSHGGAHHFTMLPKNHIWGWNREYKLFSVKAPSVIVVIRRKRRLDFCKSCGGCGHVHWQFMLDTLLSIVLTMHGTGRGRWRVMVVTRTRSWRHWCSHGVRRAHHWRLRVFLRSLLHFPLLLLHLGKLLLDSILYS